MRHARGQRSRTLKTCAYLRIPRSERSSFQAEIAEILSNVNSGTEPLISGLKSIRSQVEVFNSDEFIIKWFSFLQLIISIPNFGIRDTILQVLDLSRKLRLYAAKFTSVIPFLPRIKSASSHCSQIIQVLNYFNYKSPLGIDEINSVLSLIDDLKRSNQDIDVGPHHTRAFINIEAERALLEKLSEDMKAIKSTLVLIISINKITNIINRYTIEKLALFNEKINLNFTPKILPFNKTFDGRIKITTQESFFFINILDELSQLGIDISTDNGIDLKHDHLFIPNFLEKFKTIESLYTKHPELFSPSFMTKIQEILVSPPLESEVLELLSESLSVKYSMDFTGQTNTEISEIANSLKTLHLCLLFFNGLDIINAIPYGNSVRMLYMRTMTNIVLGEDAFNISLTEIPQIELMNSINTRVKDSNSFIGLNIKRWVFKLIRSHFIPLIEFLIQNPDFSFILNFLVQAEYSSVSATDIDGIVSKIEDFGEVPEEISKFLEDLKQISVKFRTSSDMPTASDMIISFTNIFTETEVELAAPDIKLEFCEILADTIDACLKNNSLIIQHGTDYSFLRQQFNENFISNFIELNKSIFVNHSFLSHKAASVMDYLSKDKSDKKHEFLYLIDWMSRGSLDRNNIILLIQKFLQCNCFNVIQEYAVIITKLWRFFILRDEIAKSLYSAGYNEASTIIYPSLKLFNMKNFYTTMANIAFYFNVTFSSEKSDNPSKIMELKKLANNIPDIMEPDSTIIFEIDKVFEEVYDLIRNLNVENMIPKAKGIFEILIRTKSFVATNNLERDFTELCKAENYNTTLFKHMTKDVKQMLNTVGVKKENDQNIEFVLTMINSVAFYYQTINDILLFKNSVLSLQNSVQLSNQNYFFMNHDDKSEKFPSNETFFLPLQFLFSKGNPGFTDFTSSLLNEISSEIKSDKIEEEADRIIELTESEELQPEYREISSFIKENVKENDTIFNLLQKLTEIKSNIDIEKEKNSDLNAKRQTVTNEKKEEISKIQRDFFTQYDSHNSEMIETNLELERLEDEKKLLIQNTEMKEKEKSDLIYHKECLISSVEGFKTKLMPLASQGNDDETYKFSAYLVPGASISYSQFK
ncbi:hypothetical protein TVAG_479840 [Trichomonas vaginalis G3]|uniref:Uncharacterized protein n=1 Tax=Trichomonas vaginalis (strain ATCC PRA-98 / G3) TaxID=412133 RepID=A2F8G1_TRIV3|nr:hypothetical protein TVAGG3_0278500 [Trichomonas vaginalis G3]EAX98812.1 hypothetical protein TVAG_479840 [Trichomonas vaginalis G3]KAI5526373.1 hypothetical protein TVAGG3_0278500 [Trichomonas vaginalis G3]|eukprot:XP_001311742.1 hypothetical protein [Trichomonas vaginalis G3]